MKSIDAMLVWTPNREPFSNYATAGTVAVTAIPEHPSLKGHPISVGVCDAGWKDYTESERQARIRGWADQMLRKDNIPETEVDAALSEIDGWIG